MYVGGGINIIVQKGNFGTNDARHLNDIEFEGRSNGEHKGDGLVEISKLCATDSGHLLGADLFDGVYQESGC